MKPVRTLLIALGTVALSLFAACEKQPYSVIERMTSGHAKHDAEEKGDHKAHGAEAGSDETKAKSATPEAKDAQH